MMKLKFPDTGRRNKEMTCRGIFFKLLKLNHANSRSIVISRFCIAYYVYVHIRKDWHYQQNLESQNYSFQKTDQKDLCYTAEAQV